MAYRLLGIFCSAFLAQAWPDCDKVDVKGPGPYGEMAWFNDTADDGTLVFVLHPPLEHGPFPVIIFSHGATGEYAMYETPIQRYTSHGFVVIFPHVKSPSKDAASFPPVLDPSGDFTIKGVKFATAANTNSTSKLYNMLDLKNMMLAGHSMGATSTIMAAKRLPAGTIKAAYAQHPGLCGPWGPPPCIGPGPLCNTWMPADFEEASSKAPMILSTATNDGAFLPAPHTAYHEFGCFNKSTVDGSPKGSLFVQWKESFCEDDGSGGRYDRHWSTGGHDCPMKKDSPETWPLLTAAKLYAQLNGDTSSKCHAMLWGSDAGSLSQDVAHEFFQSNPPKALLVSV